MRRHQIFPKGIYILEVKKWIRERQTNSGFKVMEFEVSIPHVNIPTNKKLYLYISENTNTYDFRSLVDEWLELPTKLVGRQFLCNISQFNSSPVDHDRWRNLVHFPICEILEEE